MAIAPMSDALTILATRFEYLVVPFKEAKNLKKDDDTFVPEQLNELGDEGWEAVGLSLKYGDLMAWPRVEGSSPFIRNPPQTAGFLFRAATEARTLIRWVASALWQRLSGPGRLLEVRLAPCVRDPSAS